MALNTRHSYADNVWAQILEDLSASSDAIYITPGSISQIAQLFALSETTDVFGYLTICDVTGNIEIVKVNALVENVVYVTRGQGGTTARAWRAGSIIAGRLIAEHLDRMLQKGIYRSGAYNPNSVITGVFTGEKFYQTGPAPAQKRWWMNTTGSKWRLLSGSMYLEEQLDEDEYILHIPRWEDYSDPSYWTPTDCTWDDVNNWWIASASSSRLTGTALLAGVRATNIQIQVMDLTQCEEVAILDGIGVIGTQEANSYWNDFPIVITMAADLDYIGLDCSVESVAFRVIFNTGKQYDLAYTYEDRVTDTNWDTVVYGTWQASPPGWQFEDVGGLLYVELDTAQEWSEQLFQVVKITMSEAWVGTAFITVLGNTGQCINPDTIDVTPREEPCEIALGADTNNAQIRLCWYGGMTNMATLRIRAPAGYTGYITKIEFGFEDLG